MLEKFFGKDVIIITEDNETFYGVVDDYIFPEDNEDNKESIILSTPKHELIEFKESEITIITIS